MTTAYTSLLGLALPVTGELSGTWGATVNDNITQYLDAAVAGTNTFSSDSDVTLVKTTNASLTGTSSQYAVLLWTAGGTATRTIIAPAASSGSRQFYIVINKTSSSQSIKLCGAGPTTGVTIAAGNSAICTWSGSDFIQVAGEYPTGLPVNKGGLGNITGILSNVTVDGTNSVGFLIVPQNAQSAGYTLVLTDTGKHIYMNSAGAFTIPANASVAFSIGAAVTFVNMQSTSSTIAITSDTMYLAGVGTTGTRTLAQYGVATALKLTSTTWIISGSGLT